MCVLKAFNHKRLDPWMTVEEGGVVRVVRLGLEVGYIILVH